MHQFRMLRDPPQQLRSSRALAIIKRCRNIEDRFVFNEIIFPSLDDDSRVLGLGFGEMAYGGHLEGEFFEGKVF